MTLDFTCQACDATFEMELSDILEEGRVTHQVQHVRLEDVG